MWNYAVYLLVWPMCKMFGIIFVLCEISSDVHLYSFAMPESCFDVRLVAINWDPAQPRKVKAVVVDSNTPNCGLPSTFAALSSELLTITAAGTCILPAAGVSSNSNNILPATSYTPFQQIVSVSPFRLNTPALPAPASNSTSSELTFE